MDDNNNLSIDKMLETAMAFSMASMFTDAMRNICRTNINELENVSPQRPLKYIYAVINGKQQGPFSLGEILDRISSGEITRQSYIWKAGMDEWKKAEDIDDIRP